MLKIDNKVAEGLIRFTTDEKPLAFLGIKVLRKTTIVQTFQPKILIHRRGNSIYDNWDGDLYQLIVHCLFH